MHVPFGNRVLIIIRLQCVDCAHQNPVLLGHFALAGVYGDRLLRGASLASHGLPSRIRKRGLCQNTDALESAQVAWGSI